MPRKTTEDKKKLFERLDKCLIWEAALLGKRSSGPEMEDVYALRSLIERHEHLKLEHKFTPAEVEALLGFENPLAVVQSCWDANTHKDGFPICELLDSIKAYDKFRLTQEEQERRMGPQAQALQNRLDQNLAAYNASLMGKSKQELVAASENITLTLAAHDYMRNSFTYAYGEADLLLKLADPLSYLASRWSLMFDLPGDDDDTIDEIIGELDDPDYLRYVQAEISPILSDKPSVLEQLRKAAETVGQRPSQEPKPQRKPDIPNLE